MIEERQEAPDTQPDELPAEGIPAHLLKGGNRSAAAQFDPFGDWNLE
jgi:hypothetical protein